MSEENGKFAYFWENANHMIFHKWFVYTINIHFPIPTKKLLNFLHFLIIFWGEPLMKPSEQSATLCRSMMTFEWMHRNIENLFRSAINNESVSRFSPRHCQKLKSGYQDIPYSANAPVSFFSVYSILSAMVIWELEGRNESREEDYIAIVTARSILASVLVSLKYPCTLRLRQSDFIIFINVSFCPSLAKPFVFLRVGFEYKCSGSVVKCAFPSHRISLMYFQICSVMNCLNIGFE